MERSAESGSSDGGRRDSWTFVSNHARVLACIAGDSSIRLRDVATEVGITERAAQSIVADLAGAGYVTRTRIGRRNSYEVHRAAPLHQGGGSLTIGSLLDFLDGASDRVLTRPYLPADAHAIRGNGNGSGRN
jgi:hypothetical protein